MDPAQTTKPITLLYFTDPICSSCWGTEPQLRRLKLEYGDAIDIQYHMGGLLPFVGGVQQRRHPASPAMWPGIGMK